VQQRRIVELFRRAAFLIAKTMENGRNESGRRTKRKAMLNLVVTLLIIALIAAVLGFGGIAGAAVGIAKIVFLVALVLFVVAALYWTGTLQLGASHPGPHHSHAILFAILGILALVWMRFQSSAPARR
jgi:uncharacterized membrane protein YtjA (UPF0391 family)